MDEIKTNNLSRFNLKEYIKKEILNWAITMIFVLLISLLFTQVIFLNANVPTSSMSKTINPNDRVIVNRLSYLFDEPKRGDIAVFRQSKNRSKLYMKRIIATPNEEIMSINGEIFINGEPLLEDYIKDYIDKDFGPYIVPENSYFLLGDNRINSLDSRFWEEPFLNEKDIVGRVILKYYPYIKRY